MNRDLLRDIRGSYPTFPLGICVKPSYIILLLLYALLSIRKSQLAYKQSTNIRDLLHKI